LYGGIVRGEFVPDRSDVNVMLVFKTISLEVLDVVRLRLAEIRRDVPISPLTLTEEDLADSAEVFPIKFLSIQRDYRLLWGTDVVASLQIPRDRLRRQCARELMNLQMRLRQSYLRQGHQRDFFTEANLLKAISPFFTLLAALIELKSGRVVTKKVEIAEA